MLRVTAVKIVKKAMFFNFICCLAAAEYVFITVINIVDTRYTFILLFYLRIYFMKKFVNELFNRTTA